MTSPVFPTTVEAITPAWLTGVLRDGGYLRDGTVEHIRAEPLGAGVGIASRLARLSLTYDRAEVDAPATLIAKLPTDQPDNRRNAHAARAYQREVGFYRQFAARSPLPAPRCYAAALDRPSGDFILLLEDLGTGRVVDQVDGCTRADAEQALVAVGRLHARWWEDPQLADQTWLFNRHDPRSTSATAAFHCAAWPRFLERYGDGCPSAAVATGAALAERIEEVVARVGGAPQTLTHGDVRLDNLFFDLPDRPVVAVDWQMCCRSGGLFDVACFLVYSLDLATRRQHEQELLRRYYEVLREGGVTGYDFDHCRDDYRWAVLFCFHYVVLVAVMDPGNARGEALFAAYQERGLAANLDWDTGALLNA